ncbi:MAG: MBL fold metallo-hydrolase [Bacteroidota bacterium]
MKSQIFTLKFGINRCYIIKGKKAIMVDGGPPNKRKKFLKQLSGISLDPHDIQLIVLTHGDFDHIGSAKDFKEVTGARVAIHKNDRINLEQGIFNWPPGVTAWGNISRSLFHPLGKGMRIPTLKPDIILNNEEFSLREFGIDGKILFTPGHTFGSASVLLDSGEAFVGCMAHNGFPFTAHPQFPVYAEDTERLKESWHILMSMGAKTIYPGHGHPFPAEKMKKYIHCISLHPVT